MTATRGGLVAGICFAIAVAPIPTSAGQGGALSAPSSTPLPRLITEVGTTRLLVNGRPFQVLGGELGNSSASALVWAKPLLAKVAAMNLNTILLPVSWELVEPTEGKLDFRLVQDLVREARRNRLHVVLLWFGSWKNGMSSTAPAWVKRDQSRFPRAEAGGHGTEALSVFSEANRAADARAFAALMRTVREIDRREQTVIMVQVENEVAMVGEAADRSAPATAALRAPVPRELIDYLQAHRATLAPELALAWKSNGGRTVGSWADLFGAGAATDELFMAWHYARYVDAVARAGKAEYPLPMFVNAALNRPGLRPGQYPSGGPLPHLYDVWKAGAPAIDLLAPDIYLPDFATWFERYRRPGNPVFVPEAPNTEASASNAFYAFGQGAIGFSPFAIEDAAPAAVAAIGRAYAALAGLAPLISAHPTSTAGVLLDKESPTTAVALGGYALSVSHDYTWAWSAPARGDAIWPRAGGLAIALGDDEFIVAGSGLIVTFAPAPGSAGDPVAGIERIDEGRVENGRFVVTRRLNGDQTHQGRHLRLPMGEVGIQRVKLYRYR